MRRTVTALVFDFDGLVLDTESAEYQSWCDVYSGYGCTLPFEEWTGSIAANTFDPYEHLERLIGRPVDREDIRAARHTLFEDLMADQKVLPGVEDYISAAKARGLRLAVASNSTRSWLNNFFERYALSGLFDVVSSRDDVSAGKPDPAVYNAALARLGVSADEAIAFEDSPNGVLAAKRAGIFCVAIPGPMTRALSFAHADIRLTSLLDISLEDLLNSELLEP